MTQEIKDYTSVRELSVAVNALVAVCMLKHRKVMPATVACKILESRGYCVLDEKNGKRFFPSVSTIRKYIRAGNKARNRNQRKRSFA